MTEAAPKLFSPIQLRNVQVKNRIMVSPMCQYRSDDQGGPGDWHLVHLGQFAIGGAGLIFHEETAVSAEGRKTWHCAGLYHDEHTAAYRRINQFLHSHGATAAIQLGHSGRKGSNAGAMLDWRPLLETDAVNGTPPWQCYSASNIPHESGWPAPAPMTTAQITSCIDDWVIATRRAEDADFDILEIHAAHGYLIHQFLSPLSNQRTDQYGGSRSNRMRFALELCEAVRAAWPAHKPLFVRVSCVDGQGGVWNMDDTVALAIELKAVGVDVIDCSSGGIIGSTDMPRVIRTPGFHLPFASRVRTEADIPVIAVGMITEARQAENILQQEQADIIAMAHELMADPGWPLRAARRLGLSDPWAVQPPDYAFRLRRRAEQAQKLLEQQPGPVDPVLTRLVNP
ncbi:MAG: NADH:flavin oxidoreductase/NADH oxidase [Burkholderiaceae bacterium]